MKDYFIPTQVFLEAKESFTTKMLTNTDGNTEIIFVGFTSFKIEILTIFFT